MKAVKISNENVASESAVSLFDPPNIGNPERRFGDLCVSTSPALANNFSFLFRFLIIPNRWFSILHKHRYEVGNRDFFYQSERDAFRVERARKIASVGLLGSKF